MSQDARAALEHYSLGTCELEEVEGGLINLTHRLKGDAGTFSLQRLHPIFGAELMDDIDIVTMRLEQEGLLTPRIVRTRDGETSVTVDGRVWRVSTWVHGETLHVTESPERLRSAASFVAKFHGAVRTLDHTFAFVREGVHDTHAHRAALADRLKHDHPRMHVLGPLAREILAHALPDIPALPQHIIHGDLKLSNVVFRDEEAVALVDMDTLQRGDVQCEMGDAFRSWCNPLGEDHAAPVFRRDLFEAALDGYLSNAPWLSAEEIESLYFGPERIALELASRFCLDAFEESYFGWDATQFESASHHNELRARGQLSLARSAHDLQGAPRTA